MSIRILDNPTQQVDSLSNIKTFANRFSEKKEQANYFKIFVCYIRNIQGTRKLFKIIKETCKWPILYAKQLKLTQEVVSKLSKTHSFFGRACKGFILIKLPYTIDGLNSSYQDYKKDQDKADVRKRDNLVKKVIELVADTSTFLQLGEIIGIYALGSVIGPAACFTGSLFFLFQHIITFKMEKEDFISHNTLRTKVNGDKRLTTLFHEIKNLDLLKVVKSIISIALSIFMVAEFVFSMSFLSPATLLFLSTTTTVLAIWAHFYQESMTYPYKC